MANTPLGVSVAVLSELLTHVKDRYHETIVGSKDVVVDIIKPLTKSNLSSYVDMIQAKHIESESESESAVIGKANLFVSHAWKGNVIHLLETLIAHGEGSTEIVYFWLDICCNNQHEIDQASGDSNMSWEWWRSSFTNLIRSCGKMIIVTAPFLNPEVCRRAWCLFEAATVLYCPTPRLLPDTICLFLVFGFFGGRHPHLILHRTTYVYIKYVFGLWCGWNS